MPIYEYKCRDCKKQFEEIISTENRDQIIKCKFCSSPNTGKVISAASYRVNSGKKQSCPALSGCNPKSGFS